MAQAVDETGAILINASGSLASMAKEDRIVRLTPNAEHRAKAMAALLAKDGIEHLIVLYRDSETADELHKTVKRYFAGRVTAVAGSEHLDEMARGPVEKALAKTAADKVAMFVIGPNEPRRLLDALTPDSPLLAVRWYGDESIAKDERLIATQAVAPRAAQVRFTCPTYSLEGFGLFLPQVQSLGYLLKTDSDAPVLTLAINAYDALWLAARAYERAGVDASPEELWEKLTNQANHVYGLGGPTFLDVNGDRLFCAYTFYTVAQEGTQYCWKPTALYRHAAFLSGIIALD